MGTDLDNTAMGRSRLSRELGKFVSLAEAPVQGHRMVSIHTLNP